MHFGALVELPAQGRVVIICDNQLAGASGVDWLPDFIRANVGPVIIVTSSGDERIAAEAFRQGAADYIDKASIFERISRMEELAGLPVIYITGEDPETVDRTALDLGAAAVLYKPFETKKLLEAVREALGCPAGDEAGTTSS